jgi:hypothetical protein
MTSFAAVSQNFYAIGSVGVSPTGDSLTATSFSNGIEMGVLYKNFNCGLALRSNFKMKDYYLTIFPTVTVYESGWSNVILYGGLGANVMKLKEVFVEVGGGLTIPLNKKKNLLLTPVISLDCYGAGSYQMYFNAGVMYVL